MYRCAVLPPQVDRLACVNTSTRRHSQAPGEPTRAPFATQSATHFDLAAKPSYEVANIQFDDRTVCVHGLSPRFTSANRLWSARRAVGLGGQRDTDGPGLGVHRSNRSRFKTHAKCFELERRLWGSRLAVYSPRADGADGQGGHDQHGVRGDGGVEPDLGFIKPEGVLAQPEFFFHTGDADPGRSARAGADRAGPPPAGPLTGPAGCGPPHPDRDPVQASRRRRSRPRGHQRGRGPSRQRAPRVLRRQRGSAFSWIAGTPDRHWGRAWSYCAPPRRHCR